MKAPAGSKSPSNAPPPEAEAAKAKSAAPARKTEAAAPEEKPAAGSGGPSPAPRPAKAAAARTDVAAKTESTAKAKARPPEGDDAEDQTAREPDGMAEAQAPAPTASAATPEPVIQAPMRPAPPPKPLGNAGKDFRAGDFVVYPTHGVGQVQGIEDVPIAGQTLKVITVTFEENRMTLKVPMAKAASSGLRKLASEKVMGEAMETLQGRARIKRTMWSRRAQEYEQKINSGDPIAIAEVVRDLHRNAGQPDQSFSERQIYELALERLAAEVGALDRTDKAAATQKLLDHLKTVEKEK